MRALYSRLSRRHCSRAPPPPPAPQTRRPHPSVTIYTHDPRLTLRESRSLQLHGGADKTVRLWENISRARLSLAASATIATGRVGDLA